jgi:5'-deoxynucleotidase YfbR-like HD superfamily hydrolase
MNIKDRLNFVIRGGATKRYHTVQTLTQETVAEHSFYVAMFCQLIAFPGASLLLAALAHDLAEHKTGDIPSPTKRACEMGDAVEEMETKLLKDHGFKFLLTESEQRILTMSDRMSGMLRCVIERRLGNSGISYVYENFCSYVAELEPIKDELAAYEELKSLWEEVAK